MTDDALTSATETYVDSIFGEGTGERHVRFLERIRDEGLREMIHRYHALEADTSEVSLVENYLIGMCVLCATKNYDTAAMFAKTLLVLGVSEKKVLAAIARLSMWIGGLPAAEASFAIQRAIREYQRDPEGALRVWFPEPREP